MASQLSSKSPDSTLTGPMPVTGIRWEITIARAEPDQKQCLLEKVCYPHRLLPVASSSFCYGFSTILRGLGALKGRECRMYGEGGEEEVKGEEEEREEEVKKKEKGGRGGGRGGGSAGGGGRGGGG